MLRLSSGRKRDVEPPAHKVSKRFTVVNGVKGPEVIFSYAADTNHIGMDTCPPRAELSLPSRLWFLTEFHVATQLAANVFFFAVVVDHSLCKSTP